MSTLASREKQETDKEAAGCASGIPSLVHHAAHLLPSQGPITVFVHHNTLHAFEELGFDDGVRAGAELFGCQPFLAEEHYHQELARGRIQYEDLDAVVLEDLGDEADRLIANFGTRYALRLAMLQFPLRVGTLHELRWIVAESDALRRFRPGVDAAIRQDFIASTRRAVLSVVDGEHGDGVLGNGASPILGNLLERTSWGPPRNWNESNWEALSLNYLWRVCCRGLREAGKWDPSADQAKQGTQEKHAGLRHRQVLLAACGEDSDTLVHEVLIRFCAAFLDQGFADWTLPDRSQGLMQSFLKLHACEFTGVTGWYRALKSEAQRVLQARLTPVESIEESLRVLGIEDEERQQFITDSLLALRGWAGMVWQMETNAEWAPSPAPSGSLVEFLAIRLILDRIALKRLSRIHLGYVGSLASFRQEYAQTKPMEARESNLHAFTIFQIAQVRGWKPCELESLSPAQWKALVQEINEFDCFERRRLYHRAYERRYRNAALDAVLAHSSYLQREKPSTQNAKSTKVEAPLYQVACCIDDREESFRRHLEEIQPQCESFGIAGFFGVAMYYRGAEDAHFSPLCPVNIKPDHFVTEEPVYSAVEVERRKADARRRIGHATHRAHLATRSFVGGALAGLLGSVAAIPLVARILFPRLTAQVQRLFGAIVQTHATELRLERLTDQPGETNGSIGYSVTEMARIVEGGLRALGLAKSSRMSKLIVICGHGSASLNNPHKAAYDCGACGGGQGGPNARAFAQMANDVRVRALLEARGISIPATTFFVGAYHNTCDDSMTWFDLDRVPMPLRPCFEQAKADVDEARKRSAHERCRRFESAEIDLDFEEALKHVEGRSEDLSQTRPECGHATNAVCLVGRRDWSRGLFLDRRAFLTSYDPSQDDEQSSILEGMLRAVIPVCAGINLEYYFSYVDSTGYGCGTKLPHNITAMIGVMDGAASDLRPGLPWQMVEIHEPVRILFVIETTPQAMQRIIEDNEAIAKLVRGGWVQLAVLDTQTGHMFRYQRGEFVLYAPHARELPQVESSVDWYRGKRQHLGFASIVGESRGMPVGIEERAHDA